MSLTLYRVFFFCFFGVRFLLKDVVLHERIEVIDEGLEVLWTFFQLPYLLVAASLIVEDADDDILIDGLSTAGSVLQNFLSLC